MAGYVSTTPVYDHVEREFECFAIKYPGLARAAVSTRASAPGPEMSTETESIQTEGTANESIETESTETESTEFMSTEAESAETAPSYPAIITLNVGGRHFVVSATVLIANSGLFRRQLSDHPGWTPQPDGTYFFDADPDLFVYLLTFLRRPSLFPVLYTPAAGFDYILYNRLEVEAEHFERAVKVNMQIRVTEELDTGDETTFTTGGNAEVKIVSLQLIRDGITLAY